MTRKGKSHPARDAAIAFLRRYARDARMRGSTRLPTIAELASMVPPGQWLLMWSTPPGSLVTVAHTERLCRSRASSMCVIPRRRHLVDDVALLLPPCQFVIDPDHPVPSHAKGEVNDAQEWEDECNTRGTL
jgi:hypothetical protein